MCTWIVSTVSSNIDTDSSIRHTQPSPLTGAKVLLILTLSQCHHSLIKLTHIKAHPVGENEKRSVLPELDCLNCVAGAAAHRTCVDLVRLFEMQFYQSLCPVNPALSLCGL